MQNQNDECVSHSNQLESMVLDFFQRLYNDDMGDVPFISRGCFRSMGTRIFKAYGSRLQTRKLEELYIFDIGGFKAPGSDCLQAIFHQSQWDFVKEHVCNLVKHIFTNPEEVATLNETVITLIPIVEPAENLK